MLAASGNVDVEAFVSQEIATPNVSFEMVQMCGSTNLSLYKHLSKWKAAR